MSEQRDNTYKKKARKWDPNIKIWTSGDKTLQSILVKCYIQSLTFHEYTVSIRKEDTGTFSYFVLIQMFSHREMRGKQKPEYRNGSFGEEAVVMITEGVELWIWKMSASLEMQSFSLAPWSTPRQTEDTPGTLWWDLFKLFGVLWHCCSPNSVSQGREEIHPIVRMSCTLVFTQAFSARGLRFKPVAGTGATCLFPPVPAGTVNGLGDVPGQIWQLSQVWIGWLHPFPGITLPLPFK